VIKVLVADDHAVVRRGLRQILSETPDIVVGGEAENAAELMQKLRAERWDVVVLDLNFGQASGLELITDIAREWPHLPVVILTVYTEAQFGVRALKSGAAGFLTKSSAPERLIEAVRKVSSGGKYVTPEIAEHLAQFVAKEGRAPHELLSNREMQILRMIGSGKTVSEIADDLSLSVKTVSTHRTRILNKMGMRTNAELTTYVVKNQLL